MVGDLKKTLFFIYVRPIEYEVMACGGYFEIQEEKANPDLLTSIKNFIQKIPKFSYPILIGYFILVICAIFRPRIFIPF